MCSSGLPNMVSIVFDVAVQPRCAALMLHSCSGCSCQSQQHSDACTAGRCQGGSHSGGDVSREDQHAFLYIGTAAMRRASIPMAMPCGSQTVAPVDRALSRCSALHPCCAALPAAAHCYLTWFFAQHAAHLLRSLHVTVCTSAARHDGCSCPHVYTTCSTQPLRTGSPASSRAERLCWDLMNPGH
jgi:hypothetical protein